MPNLVAIGLGNDLDSRLLSGLSDQFLHIPDPGSVGPFMVNLLAATRATASAIVDVSDDAAVAAAAVALACGDWVAAGAQLVAAPQPVAPADVARHVGQWLAASAARGGRFCGAKAVGVRAGREGLVRLGD